MEALLNCLWIAVSVCVAVLCLRRTGRRNLRVSSVAALGCVLLIALLLFPAISATDDLMGQPAEALHGHHRFYAMAPLLQANDALGLAQISFLLAALAAMCVLFTRQLALQDEIQVKAHVMGAGRPFAVRPPPMRG